MEEVKKDLQIGDMALADGRTEVEILDITPMRMFSTVKNSKGDIWGIMTIRLTKLIWHIVNIVGSMYHLMQPNITAQRKAY